MIGKVDPLVQISNNKLEDIKTKQDTGNADLGLIKTQTVPLTKTLNINVGTVVAVPAVWTALMPFITGRFKKAVISWSGGTGLVSGDHISIKVELNAVSIMESRKYVTATSDSEHFIEYELPDIGETISGNWAIYVDCSKADTFQGNIMWTA